jgi:hypothetical protein
MKKKEEMQLQCIVFSEINAYFVVEERFLEPRWKSCLKDFKNYVEKLPESNLLMFDVGKVLQSFCPVFLQEKIGFSTASSSLRPKRLRPRSWTCDKVPTKTKFPGTINTGQHIWKWKNRSNSNG